MSRLWDHGSGLFSGPYPKNLGELDTYAEAGVKKIIVLYYPVPEKVLEKAKELGIRIDVTGFTNPKISKSSVLVPAVRRSLETGEKLAFCCAHGVTSGRMMMSAKEKALQSKFIKLTHPRKIDLSRRRK